MNSARFCPLNSVRAPVKLYLASSNPGKLQEFLTMSRVASASTAIELDFLPGFSTLPSFEETAPTFAENAAGKALYYSRLRDGLVLADDSGLVVPALGGGPGVRSARYAGPNATNAERIGKLLSELKGKSGEERRAFFVCAVAVAERGRAVAVVTDRVDGEILESPKGVGGFGYDPVFYLSALGKTFAEVSPDEKNWFSHRGKAFSRLVAALRQI
jgi:XTP/dITP diphosphohydrolase